MIIIIFTEYVLFSSDVINLLFKYFRHKRRRERDHIYKLNCDEVQVFHELKDARQFILSYEVKNTLKFATFY